MNFKEIAAKLSKKWFHNKQLPEMAVNGNKMIIFGKCSEQFSKTVLKLALPLNSWEKYDLIYK